MLPFPSPIAAAEARLDLSPSSSSGAIRILDSEIRTIPEERHIGSFLMPLVSFDVESILAVQNLAAETPLLRLVGCTPAATATGKEFLSSLFLSVEL
jgi:hypothetical protein